MIEIVPAFLVESEVEFEKNLRLVENDCRLIQIDVLDGSLFPNTSWYDPERIGALKTGIKMELHLMVENPLPIVKAWKKHVKTFKRAIVHTEMQRQSGIVTGYIKDDLKLEVGIALNPESPLSEIEEVLHIVDSLTIMSVHPGFQAQSFGDPAHGMDIEFILEKIRAARKHRKDLIIEVDGGITRELIQSVSQAGANRLCIGSALFKTENPTATLKSFNKLIASL